MYHFCTYFDINYLPRALCLFDSLEQHCPLSRIYALCLDETCLDQVTKLGRPQVVPVSLTELETAVPELVAVKQDRSRLEYYYTCGPAFICYLLIRHPEIDIITYLDADLYFFSNPEPLLKAFQSHSIGVIPHHLPERRQGVWQGIYNVGWINFRRDPNGLACLNWWRDRCLEWCYERYEDGKYADQLYLDHWPKQFKGFYEFTYHGANVGAWNVNDYRYSWREGQFYVDDDPLIFYHFHGFKKVTNHVYNTNLGLTLKPPPSMLKRHVFSEYIERLELHSRGRNPTASIRNYRPKHYIAKTVVRLSLGILFRQYVLVFNGHVI